MSMPSIAPEQFATTAYGNISSSGANAGVTVAARWTVPAVLWWLETPVTRAKFAPRYPNAAS